MIMKKLSVLMFALLLTTYACNNNPNGDEPKVSFGIYETVMIRDLPGLTAAEPGSTAEGSTRQIFTGENLVPNADSLSAIVAYAHVDSTFSISAPADSQVKLLRTASPVDPEQHYYAFVAVKAQPVLTGSDLKTTKPNKDLVEIRFNLKGARKWAEMTRNNIGKTIAITIDDRVYALPTVMAEILEGRAMISGLESEETAVRLSAALNGD
jgi:preprotein translocase subunit SecD